MLPQQPELFKLSAGICEHIDFTHAIVANLELAQLPSCIGLSEIARITYETLATGYMKRVSWSPWSVTSSDDEEEQHLAQRPRHDAEEQHLAQRPRHGATALGPPHGTAPPQQRFFLDALGDLESDVDEPLHPLGAEAADQDSHEADAADQDSHHVEAEAADHSTASFQDTAASFQDVVAELMAEEQQHPHSNEEQHDESQETFQDTLHDTLQVEAVATDQDSYFEAEAADQDLHHVEAEAADQDSYFEAEAADQDSHVEAEAADEPHDEESPEPTSFWLEAPSPAPEPLLTLERECDLLQAWRAPQEDSSEYSELTCRESPASPLPPPKSPERKRWYEYDHTWKSDDAFWALVREGEEEVVQKSWYHSRWFWQVSVVTEGDILETVGDTSAYIGHELKPRCNQFKIGITENLKRRWDQMEADPRGGWLEMHLLYAAPTAQWKPSPLDDDRIRQLMAFSTGVVETHLINHWADSPECVNRPNSGGLGASQGTPHYVYCVIR